MTWVSEVRRWPALHLLTPGAPDGASTLLGVPNLVPANWSNTIIRGLTYTLVLHPVALGAAVAVLIMVP